MSYQPKSCDHCRQTTTYDMPLDRGSALIVLAIANAVRRLGRNRVHVSNEMIAANEGGDSVGKMVEEGYMTNTMYTNMARPRYHGLVAFVEKGSGEYLLTRKGAQFIRGGGVHKTAIIDKVEGKNAGYYEPDGDTSIMLLLKDKSSDMWSGAARSAWEYLDLHPEMTTAML